jgi:hypothetical protein
VNATPTHAGWLGGCADNPSATTIAYHFSYYEDPKNATEHPEWVGFDVYRRSVIDCGAAVRVNPEPYPREPGHSYSYEYTEAPPAQRTLYEYWAVMVDADRNVLSFGYPVCDPCASQAWSSSPALSVPTTKGTLDDWGWTLHLTPCPGRCYPDVYLEGCCIPDLRPYAGAATVVSLFGSIGCASVEGCGPPT